VPPAGPAAPSALRRCRPDPPGRPHPAARRAAWPPSPRRPPPFLPRPAARRPPGRPHPAPSPAAALPTCGQSGHNALLRGPSQMLDGMRAHITDLRHPNRDERDVIMTKIR